MKKTIILLLSILILLSAASYAYDDDDCNAVPAKSITSDKLNRTGFFGDKLTYADTREDFSRLYVKNNSNYEELQINVGETKTFFGEKVTLLKTEDDKDISWFMIGNKPSCYSYCYPTCGDSICGKDEDTAGTDSCPEDCMSKHCGDGKCTTFDKINCPEQDCKDDVCGDGRCESFEIVSCPDDCGQMSGKTTNLGIVYLIENQEYQLDDEFSVMFLESNYKEYIRERDMLATFRILKDGEQIKDFELNILNITQPDEEVPYAFTYQGNQPKERTKVDIYKVKNLKSEMTLIEEEGFFCEELFIYHDKTNYGRSISGVYRNYKSGTRGFKSILSERIDLVNKDLEKKGAFCKGNPILVKGLDLEEGYVTITVEGTDKCTIDSDCDDNDNSTKDSCSGDPKDCSHTKITNCTTGDNYCPPDCEYEQDQDCPKIDQCQDDTECDDNDACTEDTCSGDPKKCSNVRTPGCSLEDKCVPIGTRTGAEYCTNTNELASQKEIDSNCSNNYECKTNFCSDDICKKTGLLKRISTWFKELLS